MTFAVLVLVISVTNIGLGLVVASYLGRGPASWRDYWLALRDSEPVTSNPESEGSFQHEADLQRLLELADQRIKHLRQAHLEMGDDAQRLFALIQVEIEAIELKVDRLQLHLVRTIQPREPIDWAIVIETLREEIRISSEKTLQLLEEWTHAFPPEALGRLSPFQTAFSEELHRITESLPSVFGTEELTSEQAYALESWYLESSMALGQIAWQIRSLQREVLTQWTDAESWEPGLLTDPDHQLDTLLALHAARSQPPRKGQSHFVARFRLDDDLVRIPEVSRLVYRFASERLASVMHPWVPDSWLIIPLGQGNWIVRGSAESLEEFALTLDDARRRLDQVTLNVGDTSFHFTISCTVASDDPHIDTETLLLDLREAMHEAECYGGSRTFLVEEGHPVPILAESPEVVAEVVAL